MTQTTLSYLIDLNTAVNLSAIQESQSMKAYLPPSLIQLYFKLISFFFLWNFLLQVSQLCDFGSLFLSDFSPCVFPLCNIVFPCQFAPKFTLKWYHLLT